MPTLTEVSVFWLIVAVQLVGFASVAMARLGEQAWFGGVLRHAFFGCLLAVGGATAWAVYLQDASWVFGATTLGLMSVGATFECGSPAPLV
jgi:hypothetical protein